MAALATQASDRKSKVIVSSLEGHTSSVLCVAADHASADRSSQRVAAGAESGRCPVRLWDLRADRRRSSLAIASAPALEGGVTSVAFGPEDILICACGQSISAYDLRRQDRAIIQKYGDRVWGAEDFAEDELNQISVFCSEHKRQWKIACCEDGGDVHVFSFSEKRRFCDKMTASGNFRSNEQEGDQESGTSYSRLTGVHNNLCTSASWVPGCRGRTLISGSMDATVCVWNVSRGRPIADGGHITCGADPSGDSASTSGGAQLLNPPFVQCVDSSPYVCAAALGDGTVGLYDMGKLKPAGRLRGHSSATACVRFVPPRREGQNWEWLFSAGNDKNVCLWNLCEGLAKRQDESHSKGSEAQVKQEDDWSCDIAELSRPSSKRKSKKKRNRKKNRTSATGKESVAAVDAGSEKPVAEGLALDPALVGLPLRFEHAHKINWLDAQTMEESGSMGGLRLFVADESERVTVYEGFI